MDITYLRKNKVAFNCFNITGAIRGTSREKLIHKVGLEYLHWSRQMRHLCLLYKVLSTQQTAYTCDLLVPTQKSSRHQQLLFQSRIHIFRVLVIRAYFKSHYGIIHIVWTQNFPRSDNHSQDI